MSTLRKLAAAVARTPLHPQWLLGRRRVPAGLGSVRGVVLDVGAADRWIEARLPPAVDYIALDYPDTGRDMYGARPHVFADAARLPFADARIDAVICLEVIEHVPDPQQVLHEIARVLRPGGNAWLSMPFLYPVHDAPHDFQRYTVHGLRRDATRAGLEIVALEPVGHAVRAAGLLMCLAVSGALLGRRGAVAWLLAAAALPMVFAINCGAFALSLCWPDWDALSTGHELQVRKP